MRICVVGAGAIGGWVAARLALAGNKVMALTSRGPIDGISIEQAGEVQVATFDRFDGPADLLIVAVKATDLPSVAPTLGKHISSGTVVLPMLNGVPWWFVDGEPLRAVDPDGAIARAFPVNQVMGCVVHATCSRTALDCVRVNFVDKLIIGERDGSSSVRLARIEGVLADAGLRPDLTGNVRRAIWYKLWGNATINPLSALVRTTCDRILADPECRAWMLEGMGELAAVGAAIGCPIGERGEDRMAVTAKLGAFKTSMLQDVEAGRPIELEALLGAPREIAQRRDIVTPALDRLYAVTRLMAESSGLT
ncbi:2-dehydropantoate 2-reductase [Sphingomonas lutea]|uniref:2-dehydropantoate 2-reductase n=1 Tax=Sphingomonas lutea TaxID=1045317 RepID=A0A7G9SHX4_9SPHN|nr:2-dehydropantoate 2-reductase [Sphingomonas lutea]QNN67449.1 2-dehydropantoate 2-reductase [Sphingomonas lutea]